MYIQWRRKWQPTPVLLPGKSHGRRRLVGYSPWDCKELDTTEGLHFTSSSLSCIYIRHSANAYWIELNSINNQEPFFKLQALIFQVCFAVFFLFLLFTSFQKHSLLQSFSSWFRGEKKSHPFTWLKTLFASWYWMCISSNIKTQSLAPHGDFQPWWLYPL